MAVAEETGIIPPTTFKVLAATAHKTVESLSAIKDVIKGKSTALEACVKIKNTAVSTFRELWRQHGKAVTGEIVENVGFMFGPKGAVIAGAVNGLMNPEENGSKLKSALAGIKKAAVNFATRKNKLPTFTLFNKNKNKMKQLN